MIFETPGWIVFSRIFRAINSNYRHDLNQRVPEFPLFHLLKIPADSHGEFQPVLSLGSAASKFYFQVSRRRDAAFPVFPAPASMCVTLDILSSTQNTGRLSPMVLFLPLFLSVLFFSHLLKYYHLILDIYVRVILSHGFSASFFVGELSEDERYIVSSLKFLLFVVLC